MPTPEQSQSYPYVQFHEDADNIQHKTAVKVSDAINALTTEFPDGGNLSNLAWNLRNRYLAWPDSTFDAVEMQMVVEGFLAEIEALKPPQT